MPYVPVLLLAAALRIFRVGAQSMWFDEAARLLVARGDVLSIIRETGGDTLPPFYHLLIHFWSAFGWQDLYLRVPSVLAAVLLVATMAALGQRIFDRRTGLITGFIIAVMPYQVFHSQQANLYALLVFFSALQVLFFWRAVASGRRLWFAGYVFSAVAGMYVHYYAALVTLVLHIWLLAVDRMIAEHRFGRRWPSVLASDGLIILLSLPLVAYFLRGASQVGGDFWLTRPNLVAPLSTLYLFTVSYSLSGLATAVAFVLTLALLATVLLELAHASRRQPEDRPALMLLVLLAFLPIILVFLVSQITPVYLDRTLIICSPAYALILGRALATTRRRSPVPYLAGSVLLLMFFSLYGYYFDARYGKPDYRAAAEYVSHRLEPDEPIVHTGNGGYLPFLHYLGPDDHFILEGDPAPHHPADLFVSAGGKAINHEDLAQWRTVWLVVVLDHSITYQQELIAELDQTYRLLEEAVIDGIVLRRYDLAEG